jgi:exodeoxyribonuclease VII small subunit
MSTNSKEIDDLTYEEAFTELQKIVEILGSDAKPLDETMKLFERGQSLLKRCSFLLDNAEMKIQQLNGEKLEDIEIQ